MAIVTLRIGDTTHDVGCRDAGEDRLRQAAAIIEEHWADARRASGAGGANRALLLAALMVADQLIDERQKPPPETPEAAALDRLTRRLESLADALENKTPSA